MGVFKYLYEHSFLGRTVSLFSNYHQYRKDLKLIGDTLYSDAFKLVLKRYLKTEVRKDWLGRLYGVVNPSINADGQFDINSMIIEIDGDNTNNNEYVKHWVYKQLRLISDLFKIEKLYDYINIEFTHVGPVNLDNYLIVFDIVSRQIAADSVKKWFRHVFILAVIAGLVFLSFKLFII